MRINIVRKTTVGERKAKSYSLWIFIGQFCTYVQDMENYLWKIFHLFELHGDEPMKYILVHSKPELTWKQLYSAAHWLYSKTRGGKVSSKVKTASWLGLSKLAYLLLKASFTCRTKHSTFHIYARLWPPSCHFGTSSLLSSSIKTFPLQQITIPSPFKTKHNETVRSHVLLHFRT